MVTADFFAGVFLRTTLALVAVFLDCFTGAFFFVVFAFFVVTFFLVAFFFTVFFGFDCFGFDLAVETFFLALDGLALDFNTLVLALVLTLALTLVLTFALALALDGDFTTFFFLAFVFLLAAFAIALLHRVRPILLIV